MGWVSDARDLVQSSLVNQAPQLRECISDCFTPAPVSGACHCQDRLSMSRDERLHLVDSICLEECFDHRVQDCDFILVAVLALAERRGGQRIPQKIQPFFATPLLHRPLSEAKTGHAFHREKAVRGADVARLLVPLLSFHCPARIAEAAGERTHQLALVPEELHRAQAFDAPFLQCDERERFSYAAR